MGNLIEGTLPEGSKVVVVEDLISTGGSSLKAVAALPEGTSRDRTRDVSLRAVEELRKIPEVSSILSITGFGMISGRGENLAMLIVDLKRWSERTEPSRWRSIHLKT